MTAQYWRLLEPGAPDGQGDLYARDANESVLHFRRVTPPTPGWVSFSELKPTEKDMPIAVVWPDSNISGILRALNRDGTSALAWTPLPPLTTPDPDAEAFGKWAKDKAGIHEGVFPTDMRELARKAWEAALAHARAGKDKLP